MGKIQLLLGSAALAAAALWAQPPQVERGKYLIEEVGKCGDCHTPMLPGGKPDLQHRLKGATLEFQPVRPVPGWRGAAPDITAGGPLWRSWGEKGFLKYLQTGVDPSGRPAGPPMPAYRLNPADAEAMVAYLKSLR